MSVYLPNTIYTYIVNMFVISRGKAQQQQQRPMSIISLVNHYKKNAAGERWREWQGRP